MFGGAQRVCRYRRPASGSPRLKLFFSLVVAIVAVLVVEDFIIFVAVIAAAVVVLG